ncbi:hypothetical protein ACMTN4_00360 (plasmid) [Rhodococcus globerulus]|uniref:hypothetical protein n=1 Tax=Rhodococcus globerulus TaxID=33008 RepID=UPI0039E7511E
MTTLNDVQGANKSPFYAASKAAINMLIVRYTRLLPGSASRRRRQAHRHRVLQCLSHSVREGTDAIINFDVGVDRELTGQYK